MRKDDAVLFLLVAPVLLAMHCGTRLSDTAARDERAGQTIAAAGYAAHADGGPDKLRFQALYCKGREVLIEAKESYTDGGVPCR